MLFQRASSDPAANTSPHPARGDTHSEEPLRGEDPPPTRDRLRGGQRPPRASPKRRHLLGPQDSGPPSGGPEATQAE